MLNANGGTMRRVVVVILFLLSTINGAHAEGVFKPYLVESTQDPVCQLVLKHYTDLFFSASQGAGKEITSPLVAGLQFETKQVAGVEGDIKTASIQIEGKTRLVVYHKRWFGCRGEISTGYLIESNQLDTLVAQIKSETSHGIVPFYPVGSTSIDSFSWSETLPFEYQGYWYLQTELRNSVRRIDRIDSDGTSKLVCKVKILQNYNEDALGKEFPFFTTYKNVVEEMLLATHWLGTSRPESRAQAVGEYSASLAIYRPWAAKTVWDNWKYTSFQKKHFEDWKYQDIWSYREHEAYQNAKGDAIHELKNHYMKTHAFSGKKADKIARGVVESMPGHYYSLGVYYNADKDFSFIQRWAEGTYSNWAHIAQDMKLNYGKALPLVTFSVMVDDPGQIKNLPESIKREEILSFYKKDLLMYAAHMNNLDSVKYLVQSGWPLSNVTSFEKMDYYHHPQKRTNRSALTYAAENASIELIKYLVDSGADVTIKDTQGNDLDFYIRKNPRFTAEEKALGFKGLLEKDFAPKAIVPSFSCEGKLNRVEKAICASEGLSIYDRELAELYKRAASHISHGDQMKRSQIRWIKQRNNYCAQFKEEHQLNAAVARTTRARIRYLEYLVALFEKENEVE